MASDLFSIIQSIAAVSNTVSSVVNDINRIVSDDQPVNRPEVIDTPRMQQQQIPQQPFAGLTINVNVFKDGRYVQNEVPQISADDNNHSLKFDI